MSGVPVTVPLMDPRSMTRSERLTEMQRRWSEWARTATTDEPPDELFADLALPESWWRQLAKRPDN